MSTRAQAQYDSLFRRQDSPCEGGTSPVALMATVVCKPYHAFNAVDWVGCYRPEGGRTLKIDPYQGGHRCPAIPFDQSVCGQCARELRMINVPDVAAAPHHIACSNNTRSESVIPMRDRSGELLAVLDSDSDNPAGFTPVDELNLPKLNRYMSA